MVASNSNVYLLGYPFGRRSGHSALLLSEPGHGTGRCMSAQERLRQTIDQQESRLRADIPPDRQGAIVALVRTRDRLSSSSVIEQAPDLVTGRRLADLGGNKALQLCLESTGGDLPAPSPSSSNDLDGWAARFLQECG